MSLLAPVAFTSSKPAQQMAGWTEVTGGVPYFQLSRHWCWKLMLSHGACRNDLDTEQFNTGSTDSANPKYPRRTCLDTVSAPAIFLSLWTWMKSNLTPLDDTDRVYASETSVADPGCLSRIRIFSNPDAGTGSKNLNILTPKNCY